MTSPSPHRAVDPWFAGLLITQWVVAVVLGFYDMSLGLAIIIAVADIIPVVLLLRLVRRRLTAAASAIDRRTAQLKKNHDRYRELVEKTACFPFELAFPRLELVYIAPQAGELLGLTAADLEDRALLSRVIHPDDRAGFRAALRSIARHEWDPRDPVDYRVVKNTGEVRHIRTLITEQGNLLRGIAIDVTRQHELEQELQQAQKLESVWRLAAGVAHEINTPIQYVSDSVQFVRDGLSDLVAVLDKQQVALELGATTETLSLAAAQARTAAGAADLPYLREQMPVALDRAVEGLDRVAMIVRSMKAFAHPGGELKSADLNEAIANTLVVARNELRFVADVVTEYSELPAIECHLGEINQVILNLVLNAATAIGGEIREGRTTRGQIHVRTRHIDGDVLVEVTDTGGGIPRSIQSRIFDPFFTTNAVGAGTGQGLAVGRAVARRHGGWLAFETEDGKGTTFTLSIPVERQPGEQRRQAA